VEAGVRFSFRAAFRKSWVLANLLQIAGRASRLGIAEFRLEISERGGGNAVRRGSNLKTLGRQA